MTNIKTTSDFYTGMLNTSGIYCYLSPVAGIGLGRGWDGEIGGNYRSKLVDAQFVIQRLWQANTAIQKKLSSSATVKLSVNDLFYSRVVKEVINNLVQTEATWVNKSDSRVAVLTFNYRFGKAFSAPAKHEKSGAESEMNRVKN